MISETIQQKINKALKAGERIRVSTLKLLSSELYNAKIAKRAKLTEAEELRIVQHEAKKRKEAIAIYQKAGANDRAEREEKELKVLEEFLPKGLSDSELESLIEKAIKECGASGMVDMGKVMGVVMAKVKGRAEGDKVAQIVKLKLT